jgi:hypothetical protein
MIDKARDTSAGGGIFSQKITAETSFMPSGQVHIFEEDNVINYKCNQ